MTYELCKKLKDAGFILRYAVSPYEVVSGYYFDDGSIAYFPTLSELIEACGDDFSGVMKDIGYFVSWSKTDLTKNKIKIYANGSTPEEAVANLWLELHK